MAPRLIVTYRDQGTFFPPGFSGLGGREKLLALLEGDRYVCFPFPSSGLVDPSGKLTKQFGAPSVAFGAEPDRRNLFLSSAGSQNGMGCTDDKSGKPDLRGRDPYAELSEGFCQHRQRHRSKGKRGKK